MRRFTRLTNAFSKRAEKHVAMVNLYAVHYNFCRIHKTLRVTPAMEAGLSGTAHDMEWIIGLIDARAPTPTRPGPRGRRCYIAVMTTNSSSSEIATTTCTVRSARRASNTVTPRGEMAGSTQWRWRPRQAPRP